MSLGKSAFVPTLARHFHLADNVAWQRSNHRARFGVDWEHHRGGSTVWQNEPATIALFSPDQVRASNASIPLPAAFRTLNDILQLPLQSVTVAVGDPQVPQENGGLVRRWNVLRLYFQDTWRLRQGLTLNYGLGWTLDRNLNYDLTKPALLAPILGAGGLGPTRKLWKNFSPVLGLAWSPSSDGKTVIAILPAIRTGLTQGLANADQTVQAIQISKQAAARVLPVDVPSPSALHANLGVQREIARDFVVSADFAYRHFVHVSTALDLNHFNSIRGPVIPVCNAAQRNDPQALCSLGPINVQEAPGRATYKGLARR